MSEVNTCRSCGNNLTGNYCNQCGEKLFDESEKSIHHLAHEAFHFITHFDGAFFKTVRLLFFKPGQVSSDYAGGIRKKYFKPVSLFLLCVVVYLLFPFFSGLNMKFASYMNRDFEFQLITRPAAEKKATKKEISLDELAEKYNIKSGKVSKVLLLLYLPLSALALFALFYRQRKHFFDHFILSAELNSFLVAFGFLLVPLVLYLIRLAGNALGAEVNVIFYDQNIVPFLGAVFLLAILLSFKKFYKQPWLYTVIKSLLFLAVFVFIINPVYRVILFFTTLIFI